MPPASTFPWLWYGKVGAHRKFLLRISDIFSGWIGDNVVRNSGFLSIAEANDVIVVFPQVFFENIKI